MEKITIEIETVNDAFSEYPELEIARILQDLAHKIENGQQPERIRDINGNTIGRVIYL